MINKSLSANEWKNEYLILAEDIITKMFQFRHLDPWNMTIVNAPCIFASNTHFKKSSCFKSRPLL